MADEPAVPATTTETAAGRGTDADVEAWLGAKIESLRAERDASGDASIDYVLAEIQVDAYQQVYARLFGSPVPPAPGLSATTGISLDALEGQTVLAEVSAAAPGTGETQADEALIAAAEAPAVPPGS